jgi:hypothetical protein
MGASETGIAVTLTVGETRSSPARRRGDPFGREPGVRTRLPPPVG